MRISEAFKENTVAYLLTTEGSTERHVMRGLAEKYDGKDKFLYFPVLPFSVFPSSKYSVFNGILQTLNINNRIWREKEVKKYLIISDKDKRWCSEKEVEKGKCKEKNIKELVEKDINNVKFRDAEIKDVVLHRYGITYMVRGKIGNHKIIAYLCISGENKDIDENLSYLYYLKFGEKVEPEWKIIKSKLKEKNITLSNLIKQSSEKYLEKSLPHLLYPIKRIEDDC